VVQEYEVLKNHSSFALSFVVAFVGAVVVGDVAGPDACGDAVWGCAVGVVVALGLDGAGCFADVSGFGVVFRVEPVEVGVVLAFGFDAPGGGFVSH
jgi:hypothetical protein